MQVLLSVVLALFQPFVALGSLAGYFLGQWLDPDLDIVGMTKSEGRMLKIPIAGPFLIGYWAIYGAIFRRKHRSVWTHGYVLSTGIRYGYSFWWLYFVIPVLYDWMMYVLIGIFIGLCFSDSIHIWADRRFGGK
jgi:hypothetical protein